jgi:hypothetical protein
MHVGYLLPHRETQSQLYDEERPEQVHPVQHERHDQQVAVLETNHVPFVLRSWLVRVDIGQQAEGEDDDPHVDPGRSHREVKQRGCFGRCELGLNESPAERHEDITRIVDDKNDSPRCDFIAHHREEYERRCHEMMQKILIEFALDFALYHDHFEN